MLFGPPSAENLDNAHKIYFKFAQAFSGSVGDAPARMAELFGFAAQAHDKLQHVTQFGFLPLCFTLLILHEQYRAAAENVSYRVGYVFVRTFVVVGLVLGYNRLLYLLALPGGGAGFLATDELLATAAGATGALWEAGDKMTGDSTFGIPSMSNILRFLMLLGVWLITILGLLFAYVSGLLLGRVQALLMMIFTAVGTTCLTWSLVPGVNVGKSWARAFATVCAWSLVGGVVTHLFRGEAVNMVVMVRDADLIGLLKATANFILLGVFTLSVPKITSMIVSGAVSAAPAVNAAVGTAAFAVWRMGKNKGRTEQAVDDLGAGVAPAAGAAHGSPGATGGERQRPHKVSAARLKEAAPSFFGAWAEPVRTFVRRRKSAAEGAPRRPSAKESYEKWRRDQWNASHGVAPTQANDAGERVVAKEPTGAAVVSDRARLDSRAEAPASSSGDYAQGSEASREQRAEESPPAPRAREAGATRVASSYEPGRAAHGEIKVQVEAWPAGHATARPAVGGGAKPQPAAGPSSPARAGTGADRARPSGDEAASRRSTSAPSRDAAPARADAVPAARGRDEPAPGRREVKILPQDPARRDEPPPAAFRHDEEER